MYSYNFVEDISLNFYTNISANFNDCCITTLFFGYARGDDDNILNFEVLSVKIDNSIMWKSQYLYRWALGEYTSNNFSRARPPDFLAGYRSHSHPMAIVYLVLSSFAPSAVSLKSANVWNGLSYCRFHEESFFSTWLSLHLIYSRYLRRRTNPTIRLRLIFQ